MQSASLTSCVHVGQDERMSSNSKKQTGQGSCMHVLVASGSWQAKTNGYSLADGANLAQAGIDGMLCRN